MTFSFVDCFRGWNTKISARETNYGTRIDFILITPGLVPWVQAADIQPQIKGSDHCPVFVHLRDEVTNSDGSFTNLRDVLSVPSRDGLTPAQPPRLAAKYWDEHKQRLLSTFFVNKSDTVCTSSQALPSLSPSQPQSQAPSSREFDFDPSISCQASPIIDEGSQIACTTKRQMPVSDRTNPSAKKAKLSSSQLSTEGTSKLNGKTIGKSGQATIASFFSQRQPPATATVPSRSKSLNSSCSWHSSSGRQSSSPSVTDSQFVTPRDVDKGAEYDSAFESEPQLPSPSGSLDKGTSDNGRRAWRSFLAPPQVPKCIVHGEPAKEFTVNKPGPNKGKKFFICSRYAVFQSF